ncbi:MAG: DNA topoisomerase IB [Cyanobacteria bacterium P01_A01_bin.116]
MKTSPEKAAAAAGLRYVHDGMPGIRRERRGKGFSYVKANGDRISASPERERIEAIVIPPNWEEVWICPNPNGHLLATGRDAKGRKQYRYHPDWRKFRNLQKFDRMVPFGLALQALREQTKADIQPKKLSRNKVVATVVQLLDRTLIRVGNVGYAKRNQSYGLTTLRDRHVDIDEGEVRFHFIGKSGVEHDIALEDPKLANIIRRCRDIPGYDLFQYYDENGDRQTVDSGDVNDYLKRVTGEAFTAKDFRTWAGTTVATDTLKQLGDWKKESEATHNVVKAIKTAATQLGNRPATCRKYYVHPVVPKNYIAGELIEQLKIVQKKMPPSDWLDPREQAVLTLLEDQS